MVTESQKCLTWKPALELPDLPVSFPRVGVFAATNSEITVSSFSHPSKCSGSLALAAAVPASGCVFWIQMRISASAASQAPPTVHHASFRTGFTHGAGVQASAPPFKRSAEASRRVRVPR